MKTELDNLMQQRSLYALLVSGGTNENRACTIWQTAPRLALARSQSSSVATNQC